MIRNKTIICIASRWDYDPTSKHHVMARLARCNDIVWVNYRGTRQPSVSRSDLLASIRTVRGAFAGPRRVADSIVEVTPLVVPGANSAWKRWLNRKLMTAQIRSALPADRSRPIQLWTFAPDVAFLAGAFQEERLVYYCVDEFSEFADHDGASIRQQERRLIAAADVVLTSSEGLFETKRSQHPLTHLVRHGVDHAHFASAIDDGPLPADIAGMPGPIFGFFGLIEHWFDTELVAAVARARPNFSFVLIGDCRADVGVLQRLPNVHLLGRRSYADLPGYCRAFDAALLPFRVNAMTRNVNPIKLREYLAAGLPVVSTSLPEAGRYEGEVLLADSVDAFARACDQTIRVNTQVAQRRRSRLVAAESWDAVVERIELIVASVPDRRRRDAGQASGETGPTWGLGLDGDAAIMNATPAIGG